MDKEEKMIETLLLTNTLIDALNEANPDLTKNDVRDALGLASARYFIAQAQGGDTIDGLDDLCIMHRDAVLFYSRKEFR